MADAEENEDRRQLLIRAGRYTMLGGLSVLSLNLLSRVLVAECVSLESPCQTCGLFNRCTLPKAEESRHASTPGETI